MDGIIITSESGLVLVTVFLLNMGTLAPGMDQGMLCMRGSTVFAADQEVSIMLIINFAQR